MDVWFFLLLTFIYVTVSQNSQGIEGISYYPVPIPQHVLVPSSGGKRHLPVLLWLNESTPAQFASDDNSAYDVVFMGNRASHGTRTIFTHIILNRSHARLYVSVGTNWTTIYRRSKFILCPRGFGRNSYAVGEVLHMGMVLIVVCNDLIWLPYYDSLNWSQFAIIVRYDQFEQQFDAITNISAEDPRRMRLYIRKIFSTNFSAQALWRRVLAFQQGGFCDSDLRCAPYTQMRDLQRAVGS
jgi:hypothetical protein